MSNVDQFPKSLINLNLAEKRGVVCAWCEDKAAGDAFCHEIGLTVSHGMCKVCVDGFKTEAREAKRVSSREPFPARSGPA